MNTATTEPASFWRFADWYAARGISKTHAYAMRRSGLLEVLDMAGVPIVTRDAEQRMLERLAAQHSPKSSVA